MTHIELQISLSPKVFFIQRNNFAIHIWITVGLLLALVVVLAAS